MSKLSKPLTVNDWALPADAVRISGVTAIRCSGPATTVIPTGGAARSAVTVWGPDLFVVQESPEQVPSGAMVRLAGGGVSAVRLPYTSAPNIVNWLATPAVGALAGGRTTKWSIFPATTVMTAEPAAGPSWAVTVCGPALVATQAMSLHEPSGAIDSATPARLSETPTDRARRTVNVLATPAVIVPPGGSTRRVETVAAPFAGAITVAGAATCSSPEAAEIFACSPRSSELSRRLSSEACRSTSSVFPESSASRSRSRASRASVSRPESTGRPTS